MIIRIDFDSPVTLYEQLYNSIVEGIIRKELVEGDTLQPVRKVASDLSINLHTVNKAYTKLKEDGFLTANRSRGMVVSPPARYAAGEGSISLLKAQLRPAVAQVMARGLSESDFGIIVCEIRASILRGDIK